MRYIWKCRKCKEEVEIERPMEVSNLPPMIPCKCGESDWEKPPQTFTYGGPKFKGRYNSNYPK